jgi:hypothetical protein
LLFKESVLRGEALGKWFKFLGKKWGLLEPKRKEVSGKFAWVEA